MIQIYLSEGTCKKLCVKVIFRSYNFSKKKNCEEKHFPKKEKTLLSEIARWEPSRRALAD